MHSVTMWHEYVLLLPSELQAATKRNNELFLWKGTQEIALSQSYLVLGEKGFDNFLPLLVFESIAEATDHQKMGGTLTFQKSFSKAQKIELLEVMLPMQYATNPVFHKKTVENWFVDL